MHSAHSRWHKQKCVWVESFTLNLFLQPDKIFYKAAQQNYTGRWCSGIVMCCTNTNIHKMCTITKKVMTQQQIFFTRLFESLHCTLWHPAVHLLQHMQWSLVKVTDSNRLVLHTPPALGIRNVLYAGGHAVSFIILLCITNHATAH